MPTYLGWNIITIPSTPAAPASIDFTVTDVVGLTVSPFTGQQNIQDWNATFMEASVSMPAMPADVAENWVTFLRALKGQACVFQFGATFTARYTSSLGSRYWRLKSNSRKWSIGEARFYGFQFEVREAL